MQNLRYLDFSVLDEGQDVCKDCLNFKDFGDKCWYFWNEKKDCSQKVRLS